jgi:hypothetical protein
MHSLLSPLYLVLPFSAVAWDRATGTVAPHGNLTEVQGYSQIFGYYFVWQSNSSGGYGGSTSADLTFKFPTKKGIKQCIRRCYAQSARLGSLVTNEASSLCYCNTDKNCAEEEIFYSGGIIFSTSQKSETDLCSFLKSDPLPTLSPTAGLGASYSPTSTGETSQPSVFHFKTPYPTSSYSFTQTLTRHTIQPTEAKLENSTSSNLFYTKMTPSPAPTTGKIIITTKTLKPSAMDPIPMSVMVRSDSATLSPSVTVSTPLLRTNAPTIQPTPVDFLSNLVGNWVEIPPFAMQLSFMVSNISISEDQIGKGLTFYLERYIASWLKNSTKAVEVDVHLDLARDTVQSRYRSLQVSVKSTDALQYTGGYAIIYSNSTEDSSWLGSLDKCQLIDLLSLDISSGTQTFIWYIKELSHGSLGNVDAYLSTLSQVAAIPSPCVAESELTLSSSSTTSFRIFLVFLVGTLIAAVFLCGFLTVWYKKRGIRKTQPTSEATSSEVIPSQSNELMKWGTSQSTEVTTNVRSKRNSVDYILSRLNASSTIVNPKSGVVVTTNNDVEEFSQRFQVVLSGIRRNSQYISPTTSYEEDQTSQGSVTEDLEGDGENSYNWDEITRSVEDDWSNSMKHSLTTLPSYEVPSDEEKMDVWQKTSSVASFNSRGSMPNELEYHDVLDPFDMQADIKKSTSLAQQEYGNQGTTNNRNSETYTAGMGFLFLP